MDLTSQSLLMQANHGSGHAWERVVFLYRPLIYRWLKINGIVEHELDDLTQDILVTLIRELPRYTPSGRPGAFRAWLRVITTNRARLFWRLRSASGVAPGSEFLRSLADQLADPQSDLSLRWNREHDAHIVHQLLHMMEGDFERDTLEAFRRLTLEGQPAPAVAHGLGISVGAVYVAKSRVLSRLRVVGRGVLD